MMMVNEEIRGSADLAALHATTLPALTATGHAQLFPTEAQEREKERKAADKAAGKDGKARRRPHNVEQVFEDCGENDTPLQLDLQYGFFEDAPEDPEERAQAYYHDEQPERMLSVLFGCGGPGIVYDGSCLHTMPPWAHLYDDPRHCMADWGKPNRGGNPDDAFLC